MKPPQPTRLDVGAFARAGSSLEGAVPLAQLPRLMQGTQPPADGMPGEAAWQARGHFRQPLGDAPQLRLHLAAHARVWLTCQRCLQPVAHELAAERTLRFVHDEDVLTLPRALNLHELVEDELILALPLVPRHDQCPEPLAYEPGGEEPAPAGEAAEAPHPFAALARLKRG
jgi:uncharacterized protein